jgi:hypothetical protein
VMTTVWFTTKGPSREFRCRAIAQHVRNAATRGVLLVSVNTAHTRFFPPSLLARLYSLRHSVSVWQAEEAVSNLPLRLAVRGRCGQPKFGGVHVELLNRARYSRGTRGTPSGYSPDGGTHATARNEECVAVGRVRLSSFSCRLERACAAE